jgi:hypothetical protein
MMLRNIKFELMYHGHKLLDPLRKVIKIMHEYCKYYTDSSYFTS